MKATTTNVVVVGVGNSTPSAAVDWAATEAGHRGALQLLMAYDASIALPNRGGAIPADPFRQGRAADLYALAALRVSLAGTHPGLPVITTGLRHAVTHRALVRASEHALLTVVGTHRTGPGQDSAARFRCRQGRSCRVRAGRRPPTQHRTHRTSGWGAGVGRSGWFS
jgi:hypothetical protein